MLKSLHTAPVEETDCLFAFSEPYFRIFGTLGADAIAHSAFRLEPAEPNVPQLRLIMPLRMPGMRRSGDPTPVNRV